MTPNPHKHHAIAALKACIIHDGKVLMVQDEHDKRWEFPGGKVDYKETPYEALHREIQEELGIKITIHEPIGFCWSITPSREIVATVMRCSAHSFAFDTTKNPTEEDIGAVRFFTKQELLDDQYVTAHHNVKELIRTLDF